MDRREFLKLILSVSGAAFVYPALPARKFLHAKESGFGIHPFIEDNPDAVFIMYTDVTDIYDSDAKKRAGFSLGSSIFSQVPLDKGGIPLSYKVAIKPNLTALGRWLPNYSLEHSYGVATDPWFVEGIIEAIKNFGFEGNQIYLREVNGPGDWDEHGYISMVERTGVNLKDLSAPVTELNVADVVWKNVDNGGWFLKIPYLWPINAEETFLINVAKFKSHTMGLTLCAKNLQGTIAHYYQQHCCEFAKDMNIDYEHVVPNAKQNIRENYERHLADGIPRWDRPGSESGYEPYGGLDMELWATRCLDNNSVTKPAINIIEGIFGHDGNFHLGPHNGYAENFLSNVVIFGKNPFYVDIIGHWLGGHEPGNFGLFHLAQERGFITTINPARIPLYEWDPETGATPTSLDKIQRTPLLTCYLRRDYNGQTEDLWHLCDEPYDYKDNAISLHRHKSKPSLSLLNQNYPNPFNSFTDISFSIPKDGYVRIEIYDARGNLVGIPINKKMQAGSYLIRWDSKNLPSGIYLYRMLFGGYTQARTMTLVK